MIRGARRGRPFSPPREATERRRGTFDLHKPSNQEQSVSWQAFQEAEHVQDSDDRYGARARRVRRNAEARRNGVHRRQATVPDGFTPAAVQLRSRLQLLAKRARLDRPAEQQPRYQPENARSVGSLAESCRTATAPLRGR